MAGVPVMVVPGAAVAQGTATATAGMSVVCSSFGNLGKDLNQLQSSKGGYTTNHDLNILKSKVLEGEDIVFKTKDEALDFINKKFSNLKQEMAEARGPEGWHFDTHVIKKYGANPLEHINIYSKSQKFSVHLFWGV